MVSWSYIVTCKKCGYISTEKLTESKAREHLRSHLGGPQNCTRGHIKLMKVRAWIVRETATPSERINGQTTLSVINRCVVLYNFRHSWHPNVHVLLLIVFGILKSKSRIWLRSVLTSLNTLLDKFSKYSARFKIYIESRGMSRLNFELERSWFNRIIWSSIHIAWSIKGS